MQKKNRFWAYIHKKTALQNAEEFIHSSVQSINEGVNISGPNLWVLAAAIFVASLGLNTNATAVIIGAMLISPVMGPIMGIGLGLAINDMPLVNKAFRNYMVAAIISILTSSLYFLISPVKEAGSELLSRTSPTIYDVLIAFFGGLAGIIAGSSKLSRSNVIPGVAIATALMPPLCTVGYGIANGKGSFIMGALYLFFINSVFISLATYFIVTLLRYPHVHLQDTKRARRIKAIIYTVVILTLVPSIYLTYQIVKKYVFEQAADNFIKKEISNDPHHFVISRRMIYDEGKTKIELTMLGKEIDSVYKYSLQQKLKNYGLQYTTLQLSRAGAIPNPDKGMYDHISNGLEVNTGSIQDLYSRMDSLQKQLSVKAENDSLITNIAQEAKSFMNELNRINIQPSFTFDFQKNTQRKLLEVTTFFRPRPSGKKLKTFREWITNRLQPDSVQLVIR